MARAVKRKWAKALPDGTREVRETSKWYAEYQDADGVRHRVPGYTDKRATEQLAAQPEREACRGAEGHVDPARAHRQRPLAEHLDEYLAALEAKGDVAPHVAGTAGRVRAMLEGCGFRTLDDVDAGRAAEWLAGLRRPEKPTALPPKVEAFTAAEAAALLGVTADALYKGVAKHRLATTGKDGGRRFPRATVEALLGRAAAGRSPGTVNGYIRAAKGFFGWMVRAGRLPSNPLVTISFVNAKVEVRRARRELAADELRALLAAARESVKVFRGLTGADRYYLYLVAVTTGFRANALANLTPAEFDVSADARGGPTVTLPARFNKSRKPKVQPLPPDVAAELRPFLAGKGRSASVWPGTWASQKKGADMIRGDLDAAGIPYTGPGPDGPLHADFHALRHSFLTLAGRSGVDLLTLKELAGHSTAALTERYSHRRLHDLAGAVGKLPTLIPPAAEPMKSIGTDDPR